MSSKIEITKKLAAPIPTLGGTGAATLLSQYGDAAGAIRQAIEQMALAHPHGRDYQDAAELRRAVREHEARMRSLHKIAAELQQIQMRIVGEM